MSFDAETALIGLLRGFRAASAATGLAALPVVVAFVAALCLPVNDAAAEQYTLRVGSGHPAGATVYVTVLRDYLVPELRRRVAEETDHELRIIEGYGGSIASVAETLEAVQIGILDIGAYCTCFEPAKLFLHNFQYFVPFGPQDAQLAMRVARQVYDAYPWLTEHVEENYRQTVIAINGWGQLPPGVERSLGVRRGSQGRESRRRGTEPAVA